MAKATAAPGKAIITFTGPYYGHDFGDGCQQFNAGDTLEVDAEKAKTLAREYGARCPFTVGAQNKAMGGSPETK